MVPAHVWSASPDGTLDFINERLQRFLGLAPDEILGWTWQSIVHPDERARFMADWDVAVKRGQSIESEVRVRQADGQYCWFFLRNVPLRDDAGKLIKWFGSGIEIQDRKRAEQERERVRQLQADLAHVNRVSMMGELTASLTHEIKQPMFAAAADAETCLRWLARDQPDVAEAQEAASRLVKDVTRASDIINRIVLLFKKDVPQRELVAVNGVIQEVIALLRSESNRYSISIHTELTEGLPNIMADRVAMQQVLMNLMLNAIEAMKEMGTPGKLTIATRQNENRQLVVSVTDTGVGLPLGDAEQIFNAFFTSKPQGTGMGLPISRSIIESHGGRLWATSNSGPGATFQFTLPLEAAARQSA
jgi:PAS domain S-box-containing protein